KTRPTNQNAPLIKDQFQSLNVKDSLDDKLSHIVLAQNDRTKTLKGMDEKSVIFYQAPTHYGEKSAKKHLGEEAATLLETIKTTFEQLEEWSKESIHRAIEQTAEQMGLKMGKIAQPVRIAVTGGPVSPPMDVTLALLDKSEVLARI